MDGKNYQFPWYQAIAVELINKKIFERQGSIQTSFPKTIQELPALCTAIQASSGTVCDIRLTVDDYLSQMAYEGGVKILSDDGKKFTFDVAGSGRSGSRCTQTWSRTGTVDTDALTASNDRVALLLFSAGQAAFYQTGPQLIRVVKENNPDLYDNLALAPLPLGTSGVLGARLAGHRGQEGHQVPQRIAGIGRVLHRPARHARLREDRADLSVDPGGI